MVIAARPAFPVPLLPTRFLRLILGRRTLGLALPLRLFRPFRRRPSFRRSPLSAVRFLLASRVLGLSSIPLLSGLISISVLRSARFGLMARLVFSVMP